MILWLRLCPHLVPKHGARVRLSLSPNVYTLFSSTHATIRTRWRWYLGYPVSKHCTILCRCQGTSARLPDVNMALFGMCWKARLTRGICVRCVDMNVNVTVCMCALCMNVVCMYVQYTCLYSICQCASPSVHRSQIINRFYFNRAVQSVNLLSPEVPTGIKIKLTR